MISNRGIGNISKKGGAQQERAGVKIEEGFDAQRKYE